MVKDLVVIWNKHDATSVDLLVQELQGEPYDPIMLYKRQDEIDQKYSSLPQEAFLLTIQTDFQ